MTWALMVFVCTTGNPHAVVCDWKRVEEYPSREQCHDVVHNRYNGVRLGNHFVLVRCKEQS
jgi:hypothetical protein